MEKSGSEPWSKPEPDLAKSQVRVWVRGIDPDRTVGSVRGLAYSQTLANGFEPLNRSLLELKIGY